MDIKQTFINLTKRTVPHGKEIEYLKDILPMNLLKLDPAGNLYLKIGKSNTMFTSHLDTVGGDTEVTHVFRGNKIETDGKSVLGADDKAGVTLMLYMIHNGLPGLYVFFLGEESGCIGSKSLAKWIEKNKENEIYKDINKVVSLDRKDYDSVITYQMSERCCSDDFADSLIKELNKGEGMKFRKDTTGTLTDSVNFTDIYPECTNLSVGYFDQHMHRESQDIVWLEKFAKVLLKVDWDNLVIKRKPGETERLSYGSYYGGSRGKTYYQDWEDDDSYGYGRYGMGGRSTYTPTVRTTGPIATGDYVTDYKGARILAKDAVWCEYDKEWCPKVEAIWVDLIGFYTTPDEPPKRNLPVLTGLKTAAEQSSEYPIEGSEIKNAQLLKVGDRLIHPTFGKGTVKLIFDENKKVTIEFDSGIKRNLLVSVARLKKTS